ncbi:MAG: KpsF/GutQ family sugar-phosphate isomerase [Elusimicrobiales bacterium]|nr:KpsF/GutQ family sugar-phosphate isomerase [Elusimicrobiales bacterium]
MENEKNKQIYSITRNEIINIAAQVIDSEANAIFLQHKAINENFIKAVLLIANAKGKIVFSGVGKSRYVALKVSATFSSLSIPSFFLDPLDAFHGDIGSLSKDDILFLFSYSGKTKELVELLIEANKREILVISITSDSNSFIFKNSTIPLEVKYVKEACFMGLAPSSSVVAMICLGDIIGFSVAKIKGITPKDFSYNHPIGFLGFKNKNIEEIMRPLSETPFIYEDSNLAEAIEKMTSFKIGAVCIVDKELILKGFFTDGDLRRTLFQNDIDLKMPINKLMTFHPITAKKFMKVEDIIMKMQKFGFDNIPVVDENNKLLGIVDERDLLCF